MIIEQKNAYIHIFAIVILAFGIFLPKGMIQQMLASAGIFALSGTLTNWLAIHMLFEKIPFLYGSGVILNQFGAFASAIKKLMMNEFFSLETISRLQHQKYIFNTNFKEKIQQHLDEDKIFTIIVDSIMDSQFRVMLSIVGGQERLLPLKNSVIKRIRILIDETLEHLELSNEMITALVHQQIKKLIDQRLAELTPKMVKDIIQEMIRQHLGWLIVWGGIFGALIGIIAELIHII